MTRWGRVAAAVAVAVLMALSGVPPSAFGPGAPGEVVERASAASNEYYYTGDADGRVWKVDTGNGSSVWSHDFGSTQVNNVEYLDGHVYVAVNDNTIAKLDASDGSVVNSATMTTSAYGVVAHPDLTHVYFSDDNGNVEARFPSNFSQDWSTDIGDFARDGAYDSETGTIGIIDAGNNQVDILNPSDGSSSATASLGSEPRGLGGGGGKYFVGSGAPDITEIHASNGSTGWATSLSGTNMEQYTDVITYDDGWVYGGSNDEIARLDPTDGTKNWSITGVTVSATAAGPNSAWDGEGTSVVERDKSDGSSKGSDTTSSNTVSSISLGAYAFDKTGTSGGDPPYVADILPENGEYVNDTDRTVTLNASVDDPEGDPIDTTIYHNDLDGDGWRQVASQTDVSAGGWLNTTVTVDESGGENRWKVETDDDVNAAANSSTFSYYLGGQINVFNGSNLSQGLLDDRTITGNLTSVDSGFEDDRSSDSGEINLTGVPDEELKVRINATDFSETTITVKDVTESHFVLLYPESGSGLPGAGDTYTQCFKLDDDTGEFPPDFTLLRAKTIYNGSYHQVDNDEFGVENEANLTLQDGETYSLEVENEKGNIRSVGDFEGDSSKSGECITVTVSSTGGITDDGQDSSDVIEGDINGSDVGYSWTAYRDDSVDPAEIVFEWEAADNATTDSFRLKIYEYQNQSNEIFNSTFGVVNTVNHREPLDGTNEENLTWVVEWNATLDGSDISGKRIIGTGPVGKCVTPLDSTWQHVAAVVFLLLLGGLFGGVRAEAGAGVVAMGGGMLWFIGCLPPEIGVGAVIAAMAVAALYHASTEGTTAG